MFFENFIEESKVNNQCKLGDYQAHLGLILKSRIFSCFLNMNDAQKPQVGKKLSDARRSEDMN